MSANEHDDDRITPDAPLICIRCADLPLPPVKVQVDRCSLCDAFIWVALSSPKQKVLWCWECAGEEIAKSEDPEQTFAVTDDQLADVIAHFDWNPAKPPN